MAQVQENLAAELAENQRQKVRFSKISQVLELILMEHIGMNYS